MLEKDTLVPVVNRSNSIVFYKVNDLGISRTYQPSETKMISMEELRKLSYTIGGRYVLNHQLAIRNKQAVDEILNNKVEPEYFYSVEDVDKLLLHGSVAQLQDCLNFAPDGVISLVQERAVKLKINDVAKREAIREATGLNVNKAIEIEKESQDTDTTTVKPERKAEVFDGSTQQTEEPAKRRLAEAPKYTIIEDTSAVNA